MKENRNTHESDKGLSAQKLLRKRMQEHLTRELSLMSDRLGSNRNPLLTLSADANENVIVTQTSQLNA